jgi:hypothetical protein
MGGARTSYLTCAAYAARRLFQRRRAAAAAEGRARTDVEQRVEHGAGVGAVGAVALVEELRGGHAELLGEVEEFVHVLAREEHARTAPVRIRRHLLRMRGDSQYPVCTLIFRVG